MPTYGILQVAQTGDGKYIVSIDGRRLDDPLPNSREIRAFTESATSRFLSHQMYSSKNMFGAILVNSFEEIWSSATVKSAVSRFIRKHRTVYPMCFVVILTREGKTVYALWQYRTKKSKYKEATL